jgi:putative hydrolase of the HAD superfamily
VTPSPPVEVVLFDLGGVLIDFGGVGPMRELAGIDEDDELWHRWLTCRWVRAFERGECTPEEFAAGVVEDWQLRIDGPAYLAAFASWLGGALPGAEELVADVRATGVVTGCLSNTNPVHWQHHLPFIDDLDRVFLSYEVGLVKPDRELFDHVAISLDVDRSRVLFLDDNQINVDGAEAAGFRAARTRGVVEARQALVDAAVLT